MGTPEPRWATVEDVQNAWIGDELDVPVAVINTWLARAERRLEREIPTLKTRLDAGTEEGLAQRMADAAAEMVETKLRNPEGYRQIQETTGPMSASGTFSGDTPGGMKITDEMRRSLAPPGVTGGAFEVDLLPPAPARSPLEGALINGPDWMLPSRKVW